MLGMDFPKESQVRSVALTDAGRLEAETAFRYSASEGAMPACVGASNRVGLRGRRHSLSFRAGAPWVRGFPAAGGKGYLQEVHPEQ